MKNLFILLFIRTLSFTLTGCGGVIVDDDCYDGPGLGVGFFGGASGHGGHGGGHGGHH